MEEREMCGFLSWALPEVLRPFKPPSQNTDFRWRLRGVMDFQTALWGKRRFCIAVEMHSKKDATEKHPWLPADQNRLTSLLTCTEIEAKTCSTELISSFSTSHIDLLEWKFHSNSKRVEWKSATNPSLRIDRANFCTKSSFSWPIIAQESNSFSIP